MRGHGWNLNSPLTSNPESNPLGRKPRQTMRLLRAQPIVHSQRQTHSSAKNYIIVNSIEGDLCSVEVKLGSVGSPMSLNEQLQVRHLAIK